MQRTIKALLRPKLLCFNSLKDADYLEKQIVLPSKEIETSDIMELSLHNLASHLKDPKYKTPEACITNLGKAFYYSRSDLVINRYKRIIIDSSNVARTRKFFGDRIILNEIYSRELETIKGYCTSIHSPGNSNYYHSLIDELPRLYLLQKCEFLKEKEIKILCHQKMTQIEEYFYSRLLPKNCSLEYLDQKGIYATENFLFLSFLSSRFAGYLHPHYIDWFTSKISPKRPRVKNKRIFISRHSTASRNSRCILNEERVISILEKYGFQKYYLENLEIHEQIELFHDAEFVIAAHGAGLANMIFSQNIKVLELHPMPAILPHYYFLSKSLNHTYMFWCGSGKDRDSNFEVDISKLESIVKASL